MTKDEFNKHAANARESAKTLADICSVESSTLVVLPYYDTIGLSSTLSTNWVGRVVETSGPNQGNGHVVCVTYYRDGSDGVFTIRCADKFLEGTDLSRDDAKSRCDEASRSAPKPAELASKMFTHYASQPASADCNFWRNWRRSQTLCTHTQAFLAHLATEKADFLQELHDAYEAVTASIPEPENGTLGLEQLAFKVPVLFEGERGAGKTVTARAFAKSQSCRKVELGGHEGIESADLLGFLVPLAQGGMVWKDGPISEAFRAAQKQKTVLIIDEILRVRQRELSLLLTALSPDEGFYRLRTGRVLSVEDGVAQEEELVCPVENLCVVATTNVGSEYAVDDIDPALAERFVVLRKDTTAESLTRILGMVAKKQGHSAAVVKACQTFFTKMTEARARGLVRYAPTTRTLVRALELSTNAAGVKRAIQVQTLLWVARNAEGHPVPEQIKAVEALIERCFGE